MKNYLSIDIGGTNIKYGILNRAGQIIEKDRIKTPDNLADFMQIMDQIISQYIEEIRGIAFSCPGKIDAQTGTIYFGGALTYLHKLPLAQTIQDKYQVPVAVENDGKAAALAELWLGNLQGVSEGAAIVLGTGVGGGVIMDGKLRKGVHDQAGEFSFLINNKDAAGLSRFTALNTSAVNMIRTCAKQLQLTDESDGLAVFQAINQQDERVMPIFKQFCQSVGILILNIQAVVDLDQFVIAGGISAQPVVTETIRAEYNAYLDSLQAASKMITRPAIVSAKFFNDANLYGALYHLLLQIDQATMEAQS